MLKAGPHGSRGDIMGILFAPTFSNYRWPLNIMMIKARIAGAVKNLHVTFDYPPNFTNRLLLVRSIINNTINTYFDSIIYSIFL